MLLTISYQPIQEIIHSLFFILTITGILFISSPLYAENKWELKKQQHGIQVYTRDTPNSNLKSFKGTVLVTAKLSTLVAVLQDKAAYPQWIFNCVAAKSLKQVNPQEAYSYTVSKLPWPFKNRDSVVRSILKQNKKTKQIVISLIATPNFHPLQANLVRVKTLTGHWILTPKGNGKVSVSNEMMINPAGNLPQWIVNQFAVNSPFHTLSNLQKMLQKPKYKKAKFNRIIN